MVIRTEWGDFSLNEYVKINPYTCGWIKEFLKVFPTEPKVITVNATGIDHPVEVIFDGKEVSQEEFQRVCDKTCTKARANLYKEGSHYLLVAFPNGTALTNVLTECLEPLVR